MSRICWNFFRAPTRGCFRSRNDRDGGQMPGEAAAWCAWARTIVGIVSTLSNEKFARRLQLAGVGVEKKAKV
jgi:hypothetical protein